MDFLNQLFSNLVFISAVVAWFIAQVLKVIGTLVTHKKLVWERLLGAGGMPSSHSAFVSALTTAIGLREGFDSSTFALSTVFAFIVMYDATGIRQAAGKQAKLLNQIVEDFYAGELNHAKLKELLGHSPVEVLAGAILGIVVAFILK